MNKFVIYTIMVGKYGKVRQPLCLDERFDYVLFSNDFTEPTIGVWQVRPLPIPPEIAANDNKRLSRYPKTHPETMLAEYEVSLYMDANIQIADRWVYDRIVELAEQKVDYAGIKLLVSGRTCIYRHAYDMCMMRAEHDYNAIVEMHALYKEGFPEHFGLNENNIIFRCHNEKMKKVDELWWQWIVNYSYRDQFSYMYCLWKNNIPIQYFLPEGEDSHNSQHFVFTHHNGNPDVVKKKWISIGLMEKCRNKCRALHRERYCEQWVSLCKTPFPLIFLTLWGIGVTILNTPLLLIRKMKKGMHK